VRDSNGELIKGRHHEDRAYGIESYLRIQDQIATKRRRPFGSKSERPNNSLIGLPKCASCLETLHYRYIDAYLTFRCNGYRSEGESRHVLVRADILEKAVLHEVAKVAQSDEVRREARQRIGQEVRKCNGDALRERATLEARKSKYDAQVEDALRQLRDGVLSESMFKRQMDCIKDDQEKVEARLSELAAELTSVARIEDLERRAMQALENFQTVWKHLEPCERTRLFETVLESLVVEDRGGHSVAKIKLRLVPEKIVVLPRVNAPKGSNGGGGIEYLTESEMAALWHLAQGHSPSQSAAYMNIERSTFSTFTARAAKRMGESVPAKAARRAKPWIDRVAHLLPLYEDSRVRFRNAKRPPVIQTTVRMLAKDGLSAEEISAKIGIDLARVQAILDGC
jgi:DNA-binding CsgD family transcriptional regulator